MKSLFCFLLFSVVIVSERCWSISSKVVMEEMVHGGNDKPLFLTPYIRRENGRKVSDGEKLSQVHGMPGNIVSHSGLITVNETYRSNMFFWFVSQSGHNNSKPVVVWLQGGPGSSSMFGLFSEMGPWEIDQNGNPHLRDITWTKDVNMIFIDNPVGVGFSFTNNAKGFVTTEDQVGSDLYEFISQWFQLFPQFKKNEFFISGESYAGKYVPAFAAKLQSEIVAGKSNINFKGILVGDGISDPLTMTAPIGDLLYYSGLIDYYQSHYFNSEVNKMSVLAKSGKMYDAFLIFDMLLNGDIYKHGTYIQNVTGCTNYFNREVCHLPPQFNYFHKFLVKDSVKRMIHVSGVPYNDGNTTVEMHLLNDFLADVRKEVEYLISQPLKILYYSGQLDVIVPTAGSEAFIRSLSIGPNFQLSPREIWKTSDGQVAGYKTVYKDFQFSVIRSAGHMVPADQPLAAYEMAMQFIFNK